MRAFAGAGARAGWLFYAAIGLSVLPLALAKVIPLVSPKTQFGFLGISYVTFRALDIVFCLRDGVIARPGPVDLFMFLFFFPTISAGPMIVCADSLPRRKNRSRTEPWPVCDGAVNHFFRGLLYKFILAALIEQRWLRPAGHSDSFAALVSYMYAYSFYLFFDFAGYSAFAISISYLFGSTLRKTLTGRSLHGTFVISGIAGISPFPSGFAITFTCVSCSPLGAANGSKACIPPRSWDISWPLD